MDERLLILTLCAHAGATWALVGLIWFVQVVHYPLFIRVGVEGFARYAGEHQSRTTLVVGPLMLIEAGTTGLLLIAPGVDRGLSIAGAGLLALVWASTFFVQVPLHAKLSRGMNEGIARRLVRSNWIRTIAWSARGVVALAMILGLTSGGAA